MAEVLSNQALHPVAVVGLADLARDHEAEPARSRFGGRHYRPKVRGVAVLPEAKGAVELDLVPNPACAGESEARQPCGGSGYFFGMATLRR